jgi:hypothetical protein
MRSSGKKKTWPPVTANTTTAMKMPMTRLRSMCLLRGSCVGGKAEGVRLAAPATEDGNPRAAVLRQDALWLEDDLSPVIELDHVVRVHTGNASLAGSSEVRLTVPAIVG